MLKRDWGVLSVHNTPWRSILLNSLNPLFPNSKKKTFQKETLVVSISLTSMKCKSVYIWTPCCQEILRERPIFSVKQPQTCFQRCFLLCICNWSSGSSQTFWSVASFLCVLCQRLIVLMESDRPGWASMLDGTCVAVVGVDPCDGVSNHWASPPPLSDLTLVFCLNHYEFIFS